MSKNKNILICTPLSKLIPREKENVLIFPPNLVSNSVVSFFKTFKYKEPKYRWSDKSLVSEDYIYLKKFYEQSLDDLSNSLNDFHKKKYSKRFWRILIGPWLSSILFILFERYHAIKSCYKSFKIDQINFLKFNNETDLIPNEMNDYTDFLENTAWNQDLYQEIISNFYTDKKIIYVDKLTTKNIFSAYSDKTFKESIKKKHAKSKVNHILTKISNLLPTNRFYNYFLSSTHLSMFDELKLSLKLKQFPIFYDKKKLLFLSKIDLKNRNEISQKNTLNSEFEKILFKIAINKIPKCFLEEFANLYKTSNNANYPKNPKVIFSSNFLWQDAVAMCYSATKIENGTKLIYGQHGGSYGVNKVTFSEDHEIKISDKYISWGWKDKNSNKKIINLGIITNRNKILRKKNSNKLLIILRIVKKYFHLMHSGICTEQSKDYISYCTNLFNNLSSEVKKNSILRLQTNAYKNEILKDFKKENGELRLSNSTFWSDCKNSKLIVNTCNSTPFLQTLSFNLPSIVIWNKCNEPIRNDAINYMDLLHKNKILFYDPKKAAKFINKIWKNEINEWWLNNKTQYAIQKFTDVFSKRNDSILSHLEDQIKNY